MNPIADRNRKNAISSTGPKTEEGKARSSRNALDHGFYAQSALLPTEDAESYHAHTAAYVADLKAEGDVQIGLAITASDNAWLLRRALSLVAKQNDAVSRTMECFDAEPSERLVNLSLKQTRILEALGRHARRLQTALDKALAQLREVQKLAERNDKTAPAKPQSGFVSNTLFETAAAAATNPQPTTKTPPETVIPAPPQEQKRAA